MKRTWLVILLTAAVSHPAELPVTQVMLYKHGVGFFERSGTLAAGESARLDFDSTEMNDVLKSLTIEERGGGKISGLRYDSFDPLGHILAQFPFQIGPAQPLSGMLDQLKGSRLELTFGGDTVSGVVVSGRVVEATPQSPSREQLTLLMDSGDLRTVDLGAASGIRFVDPRLQQQFRDYLTAMAASRSKDKRSVYIDSTDQKERQIAASYIIPTAVWKSSYRLIVGASGQPTLEGWAIVDNTTGDDWTKVRLALVSGRPISFVSQLYAPKYVTRPGAELADDNAAQPVVHEGAFAASAGLGGTRGQLMAKAKLMAAPPAASPAPVPQAQQGQNGIAGDQMAADARQWAAPSSIVASASAGELGELFEYVIGQPVTIRKNQSAMLPFLQQAIDARRLLIYSDHNSPHPTNAAELINTTGKTLDGGPITVYDGGAYGGEALMETLKAGDKRLISYAVDLGTRITEAFGSKQAVAREIRADHGMLTSKMAAEETRTYTARNVDKKAKTLIIEHPLRPGYTLLNQKPAEKTSIAYRFEVQLAPDATSEFAVSEERIYDESYAVASLDSDAILVWTQNKSLSEAGRRQLQQIANQKNQIADTERALAAAETETRDLTADEERIRRNIQSLNSVSGQQQQVQNYARQLSEREQQLVDQRDRQADLAKKKTALQNDLDRLVAALTF